MGTIARNAELKQQVSVHGGYASVVVDAKHELCNATPMFPVDKVDWEEAPDYCAGFDEVGEAVQSPGYGEHSLEFDRVSLADLILLAELGMAGGKTPTGAGPYVWTWDSADVDDLAFLSAAVGLELGTSGTNFIKRFQNGQLESLEILIDSEKSWVTATAKFRGDESVKIASFAATEAVGHSATRLKSSWLQLFIDDAPGNIGTTEVTCARLNVKINLNNNLDTVQTDCGAKHERGKRHMQIELRLLLNTDTDDVYDDYAAETVRYVQLLATDPSTAEFVRLNFCGHFRSYEHGEAGSFQDMTLVAKSKKDATLGYSWQFAVSHDDADALDWYNS